MAQVTIKNGDSGLTVRNNLNAMFTELYSNLPTSIKIEAVSSNDDALIAPNTYIGTFSLINTAGTPTIRIGTTPNGTDIMPDTLINGLQVVDLQKYFQTATTLYITFTGTAGTVNIRINILPNYF